MRSTRVQAGKVGEEIADAKRSEAEGVDEFVSAGAAEVGLLGWVGNVQAEL